ncbi:MAG TPA: hypothetical protein VN597_05725, partial [Streptosporangiaceae bacterium]|nr:hypothetical protein [Streptosporangiaceae bacterium]
PGAGGPYRAGWVQVRAGGGHDGLHGHRTGRAAQPVIIALASWPARACGGMLIPAAEARYEAAGHGTGAASAQR